MKNYFRSAGLFGMLVFALMLAGHAAQAATPTLSLVSANDGDAITATIRGGDANSSVLFGYTKVGGAQFLSVLGKTDASGHLSVDISTSAYNINPGSVVRVTVNSQRSNELQWPTVAAGNSLLLSESSLALQVGQTKLITATGNGSNLLFLSNNSNPRIANVNISGNQITIQPLNIGSTLVMVCANTANAICSSAYVNVQNTASQPLVFSQSNANIANGQSQGIGVLGGNGNYIISNNTNSQAFTAVVSGTNINLTAKAMAGYSAVTVCTTDMSACGVINANVSETTSTGLSFSQTNPTIQLGQTVSIGVTGGATSGYSIFSNSNSQAVSAAVSGGTINLVGLKAGTSLITVCSGGSCGNINATVLYADLGGNIRLNQSNLWLSIGQSQGVTISGGSMPYSAMSESTTTAKVAVSNNVLTVTGVGAGTANINVCSAQGGCTTLSVLVNGTSIIDTAGASTLSLTPNNTTLFAGNSQNISINGNGTYIISQNTMPAVASAAISGGNLSVTALAQGGTNISICQNGGQCASVYVNVIVPAASEPEPVAVPAVPETIKTIITPPVARVTVIKFKFTKQLQLGSSNNDVKELQKRLQAEKLYTGKVTGKFDANTRNALRKFQKKKNISQTGNLGQLTIKALNK